MRRSRSIRAYVVRLVIAVAVPLLAFGAFLLIRSAHHDQQVIATTADERARGAAEDLDRELHNLQDLLSVVARSDFISGGDLARTPDFAVSPLAKDADLELMVWDLAGNIISNTCGLEQSKLVVRKLLGDAEHIDTDGQVHIPYAVAIPADGNPIIAINVPIKRENDVLQVVSLCALPRISRILTEQHLPDGWTAAVIDRQGQVVASTSDQGASIGVRDEQGAPLFSLDGKSLESRSESLDTALRVIRPIAFAGWSVSIEVPGAAFFDPVRRSLLILLVAGGGTAALALVLAVTIGRRIAGPIIDLTRIVGALGSGAHIAAPVTGIREADLVARALCSTSEDLSRRTDELTTTIVALRRSETRLRRLSDDLRRALDERTRLLNRMVSAQEDERQRIARELHDQLGQYFAVLLLGLDTAKRACRSKETADGAIDELKTLALSMNREVHQLAWELRPVALDDLGLEAAIAIYLEKWSERFDLEADFFGDLRGRRLSSSIEITLYRVFQEAVTNVAKHAHAARVTVVLMAAADELRLIVQDDGAGFAQEHPLIPGTQVSGLGILGMRERLALVGGSLAIETTRERGTTLFCRVPA